MEGCVRSVSTPPGERLLQRLGVPVRLGGRSLDLLVVLVESAGSAVSKRALLDRVWGDVVVDEGSLRFYMHAVRKALGDGEGGQHFIVSTANKGYTFVADVDRRNVESEPNPISTRATRSLAMRRSHLCFAESWTASRWASNWWPGGLRHLG